MIQRLKKEIPSTDGVHTLRGIVLIPESPRGILQIVHGKSEHIARYEPFMTYLAENGFAVCGHDHIGHGYTAQDQSELGHFAEKNGHRIVCDDVCAFGESVKADLPGLPFFLLGHSMGSFIARCTLCDRPDLWEAAVIMGTSGKNPLAYPGLFLARLIGAVKGKKYISQLVLSVAFSSYNDRTESNRPYAWLSRDEAVQDAYERDPFCGTPFTVSAMCDLIRLQILCNRGKWYKALRKDLPILLVSGSQDPVGNYGKGVEEVYTALIAEGVTDADRKLYGGMRHEILNELGKEEVYGDILRFLEAQL